jgi:serine/threonine protein kinase
MEAANQQSRADFERVEAIGKGGQARVEVWRQKSTGLFYAAKVYAAPSPGDSDRIANEARMLRTLKFPSLIQGYAFFIPSNRGDDAAIVMEHMSGGSLATASQESTLDATAMNNAIIAMIKGLMFLHQKQILHGDLKPSSILFTADGFAKIGDFGSAVGIGTGTVTQARGGRKVIFGAPQLDIGADPSEASDIFALSLTMYETLARQPAFDPNLPLAKLIEAVDSARRPEVPPIAGPELAEVIKACWDKEPKKRMTAVQIATKLSEVGWAVVKGTDAKAVKAFLRRFPLDASFSRKESEWKVEALTEENGELKSENTRVWANATARGREITTLESKVRA